MVKMKMLNEYKMENVSDHLREEFEIVLRKMLEAIVPIVAETNSNIALSALVHAFAIFFTHLISNDPEEIKKAAATCAKNFIKNVEFYTKVDIFEKE